MHPNNFKKRWLVGCLLNFLYRFSIQVHTRANEMEPCGWWLAKVKMSKGEFHVIEYQTCKPKHTEIVTRDRLRKVNPHPLFTSAPIVKASLPVPEDLQEL